MYPSIKTLSLLGAFFVSACALAQTADNSTIPPVPHAYHFTTESVWAKLSILVIDQNGHFELECQSDNPLEGWVLTHRPNNQIVSDKEDNETDNFKVNIAKSFDDYELTVFVNGANEQIPMVINLAPDKNSAYTLPLYTPFEESPNRPFNTLVKSLYDQAGQAYVEGKNANAIDLLHKALKVDASEPQVLAFLAKLDPTAAANPAERSLTDSLAKAQKAEANRDYHEAKNLYSEVLSADPGNKTATDGLKRVEVGLLKDAAKLLEGYIAEGDSKKAKTILAKIEQSFPNDDRIKDWQTRIAKLSNSDSSTDRKAKADEAYNLGLESYRKDDFASAKKFWEEALQIDPHYIQAQQNLNRLTQEHPGLQ